MQTLTRKQLKATLDRHEDPVLINVLGRAPFERAVGP
jgi:hypothetical protein